MNWIFIGSRTLKKQLMSYNKKNRHWIKLYQVHKLVNHKFWKKNRAKQLLLIDQMEVEYLIINLK